MMNLNTRPDRLILKVVPGGNGSTSLYEDEGDTQNYQKGVYTTTRMRHENQTLVIEPRQGAFPGMLKERAYTIEFLAIDRPQSVTINGKQQANGVWNYNEKDRKVTVYVPQTPCDQQLTVTLGN